ncbi:MAG: phage holin family protein [Ferruginibacter sp.]|nr:phage holin family protein [Ferruginibacter sp.]
MKFLLKILITTVNAFVLANILPGIEQPISIITALELAIILAVLNATVKPLLVVLTFPVTILTLGMFLFIINTCIILIAEYFIDGFQIEGFWYAALFSILLSFFNSFVHKRVFAPKKVVKHNNQRSYHID